MQTVQAAFVAAISAAALVVFPLPAPAGEKSSLALTISIDGAIGPAAAHVIDLIAREDAEKLVEAGRVLAHEPQAMQFIATADRPA